MQDRKESREDRLRQEAAVFDAGTEYAAVCSAIVTTEIKRVSAFNFARDMAAILSGTGDPKATDKSWLSSVSPPVGPRRMDRFGELSVRPLPPAQRRRPRARK